MDTKSLVGYDLDGVLVADCTGTIPEIVAARKSQLPLFSPNGDWFLLTGRPKDDRDDVLRIVSLLRTPPVLVFADCQGYDISDSTKYKRSVLLALGDSVRYYVESDINVVSLLSDCCPVLHFSTFLESKICQMMLPSL